MNKTLNINLGGYPFVIDEDAYEAADQYLQTLSHHFSAGDGSEEIMQDIENRMGELINRNKANRTIVNKMDILEAIAVLGTPEELKDIDFSESVNRGKKANDTSFRLQTGKRLYRDKNDKFIGGVCSGLAAYFGIQDVVWMRLAFVLLFLAGGASVILYIVLWAIVPPAKTVSDRLEMMGEPTNVNNIAKMVKEEFESLSDTLHDKFSKKHKSHKRHYKNDEHEEILTSGWSWNSHHDRCRRRGRDYKNRDFV